MDVLVHTTPEREVVARCVDVYAAAFGEPPYDETREQAEELIDRVARYGDRDGFALVHRAFRTAPEQPGTYGAAGRRLTAWISGRRAPSGTRRRTREGPVAKKSSKKSSSKGTAAEKDLRAQVKKLQAKLERAEKKADRWKSKAATAESAASKAERKLKKARKKSAANGPVDGVPEEPLTVATVVGSETLDAAETTSTGGPDETWTVAALKDEARSQGVTGFSRMSKAELVAALR